MDIKITRNPSPASPPTDGNYGFGSMFTPHMFQMEFADGAWGEPSIQPIHDIVLHPASKVLHYGQEIFEGMKAYTNPEDGSVHMFRPDMNIKRFNRSCERMCMPTVDADVFMDALKKLIDIDREWVPESPSALYIRPTMISTQPSLGVKASDRYLFYIIIGPVGSYFAGGINPLRLKVEENFVRSAPGGVGSAKTGGNYAAALLPIKQAVDAGFDQIVWLDAKTMETIEEMGAMNIAFVYEDKVITAPLSDTILHGVTRESVGVLCGEFGLNWTETPPKVAEICADADSGKLLEAFACGTAAVVTPIKSLYYQGADHVVGDGGEGPVTNKLRKTLTGIHSGTSEVHPEWIEMIPLVESV
jgi:branched-chain amino acid aminotransferase